MTIKDLLNEAYIILQKCDLALTNNSTENHLIINILKREFEEITMNIEKDGAVSVLNKNRDTYSTRLIVDSANLSINKELFDLIFTFAENIKKVDKKFISIK